jgi:hypothetical protein
MHVMQQYLCNRTLIYLLSYCKHLLITLHAHFLLHGNRCAKQAENTVNALLMAPGQRFTLILLQFKTNFMQKHSTLKSDAWRAGPESPRSVESAGLK